VPPSDTLLDTAAAPERDPDPRIAHFLTGMDPETAAVMLVHLAADPLRQQRVRERTAPRACPYGAAAGYRPAPGDGQARPAAP